MAERLITDSSLARAAAASYARAQAANTRVTEQSLRAAGQFDEADMVRQFADGLELGHMPDDVAWADRGRPVALEAIDG